MSEDTSLRELYALCQQLIAALAVTHPELISEVAAVAHKLRPRRHGPGFSSVLWDGTLYSLSATQAAVVATLWEAMEAGTPDVKQEILLDAGGSDGRRLAFIFRDHPCWGKVVVPGSAKGTFRLAP